MLLQVEKDKTNRILGIRCSTYTVQNSVSAAAVVTSPGLDEQIPFISLGSKQSVRDYLPHAWDCKLYH
jgi:hypothetical protein